MKEETGTCGPLSCRIGDMMRHMKLAGALLIVALFAGSSSLYAKEPSVRGGQLGFSLQDLDGHVVSSSDSIFTGKVLFVTIWGTWCPPCVSEVPTFKDLQDRYGEDGLVIVAIAVEPDTLVTVRMDRLRDFSR